MAAPSIPNQPDCQAPARVPQPNPRLPLHMERATLALDSRRVLASCRQPPPLSLLRSYSTAPTSPTAGLKLAPGLKKTLV